MFVRPLESPVTHPLIPYTTLFRSLARALGWPVTTRAADRRLTASGRRRCLRRAAARACPPWRRTHPPARPRPFARTQARAAGPRRSPLAARTPALVVRRQRRSPRRRRPRRIRNARRLAQNPRSTPALATVGRGYAPRQIGRAHV